MTKSTFGEHLKREREMRGVSLEEISAATRIGTRFLEALENEQWNRLPGGVFNRGFVRSVAHFLGLNEDDLVAEYEIATGERTRSTLWGGARNFGVSSRHVKNGRLIRLLILLVLVVAIIAAGWYGWRRYKSIGAPSGVLHIPGARLTNAQATPQEPAAQPEDDAATRGRSRGATRGTGAANPAFVTGDNEADLLNLTVSAGKPTTIRVVADGKILFDGRMPAEESRRFQAKEQFEVWAGNSGAVLLELNGQTVPPLGPPGSPGQITLTRKDLKSFAGGTD